MAYATLQQLTDRYGATMLIGLTDRAAVPTGAVDVAVVNRALADTDEAINSHIRARYAALAAPFPAILVDLALAIAIYKLHVYEPDAKIVRDYQQALATLKDLAKGTLRLDVAGVEPATDDGGGARVTDRERPFTAETMSGFV